MKTVKNFVKAGAILACSLLFTVTASPGEATTSSEGIELLTG